MGTRAVEDSDQTVNHKSNPAGKLEDEEAISWQNPIPSLRQASIWYWALEIIAPALVMLKGETKICVNKNGTKLIS